MLANKDHSAVKTWVMAFATFFGATILATINSLDYSISDFLLWDDNLWIYQSLINEPGPYPTQPVLHYVINIIGSSGSLLLVKLLPLVVIGLLATIIALSLASATRCFFYSIICSFLIALYPAFTDQTFYVIGTHPTFGVMLGLTSLYVYWLGWHRNGIWHYLLLASASLLSVLAALSSAMLTLATVAPLAWLIILTLTSRNGRTNVIPFLARLVLAAIPLAYHLHRGMFRSVYGAVGASDRLNVSVDNILPSLTNAIETLLRPWHSGLSILIVGAIVVALVAIAFFILLRSGRRPLPDDDAGHPVKRLPAVQMALMSLALSALAFGPNVAVAPDNFRTRYIVAPFVAAAMAVVLLLWVAFVEAWQKARVPVAVVDTLKLISAGAVILFAFEAHVLRHDLFGGELLTFQKVQETALSESANWPEDAQVLFAVPLDAALYSWRSPSFGLPNNLYTNASLRQLTGSPSLQATIASTEWLRNIAGSSMAEHDEGRRSAFLRLLKPLGLSARKPLFAYTWEGSKESGFELHPLVIWTGPDESYRVPAGTTPRLAEPTASKMFDAQCSALEEPYLLAGTLSEAADRVEGVDGASWTFDGQSSIPMEVEIGAGEDAFLSFSVVATEFVTTQRGISATYPPMPLTGPNLSVFQVGDKLTLHAGSRREELQRITVDDGTAKVGFLGREGCRYLLLVDDIMVGVLEGQALSGSWTLGKGVAQRYWTGRIEDWRLGVKP
ncbi:hypothetical protein [Bauldia litoralis]|uniref:Uncharacterized protein n=1 Tax=Bauldia litoralis TaxID=665467 RepID=A0A1G6CW87_9HYPH|nr:hypothetical protein [Bauldia litoralis]SDB37134.1 hypothetical protein SAMN02982931_02832 [Bauldia litoralis]